MNSQQWSVTHRSHSASLSHYVLMEETLLCPGRGTWKEDIVDRQEFLTFLKTKGQRVSPPFAKCFVNFESCCTHQRIPPIKWTAAQKRTCFVYLKHRTTAIHHNLRIKKNIIIIKADDRWKPHGCIYWKMYSLSSRRHCHWLTSPVWNKNNRSCLFCTVAASLAHYAGGLNTTKVSLDLLPLNL